MCSAPKRLFRAAQREGRFAVLGEDGGGRFAVGAPADILTLDYAAMTRDVLSPTQDHAVNLLQRATRRHIKDLIVAGRRIVADGRCVSVDLPALEADLYAQARAAWAKSPPDDALSAEMRRAARRFYGCGCHMGRPYAAQ